MLAGALRDWQKVADRIKENPNDLAQGRICVPYLSGLNVLHASLSLGSDVQQRMEVFRDTCIAIMASTKYTLFEKKMPSREKDCGAWACAEHLISNAVTEWCIFAVARFSGNDALTTMFATVSKTRPAYDALIMYMRQHCFLFELVPMKTAFRDADAGVAADFGAAAAAAAAEATATATGVGVAAVASYAGIAGSEDAVYGGAGGAGGAVVAADASAEVAAVATDTSAEVAAVAADADVGGARVTADASAGVADADTHVLRTCAAHFREDFYCLRACVLREWKQVADTIKECPSALEKQHVHCLYLTGLSVMSPIISDLEQRGKRLFDTCMGILKSSGYRYLEEPEYLASFEAAVRAAVTEWVIFAVVRFGGINEITSYFASVPSLRRARDKLISKMCDSGPGFLFQLRPMEAAFVDIEVGLRAH